MGQNRMVGIRETAQDHFPLANSAVERQRLTAETGLDDLGIHAVSH
jgi:hypothetical protein